MAELAAYQKHIHGRILTETLLDQIIVRYWKKDPRYPKKTEGKGVEDLDVMRGRMKIWETFIDEEPAYLKWLVAPLAESIDWDRIHRGKTANDRALLVWTKACLTMAAETAWMEGRDEYRPNGKRIGGNAGAYRMNRKWEQLPENEEWKPRLERLVKSVVRDFGYEM
jgi:hypothetical protein